VVPDVVPSVAHLPTTPTARRAADAAVRGAVVGHDSAFACAIGPTPRTADALLYLKFLVHRHAVWAAIRSAETNVVTRKQVTLAPQGSGHEELQMRRTVATADADVRPIGEIR